MRTLLAILLLATPVAGQVCTGDIDQDGTTSIADIVTVVNESLGECGEDQGGCTIRLNGTEGTCQFSGDSRGSGCRRTVPAIVRFTSPGHIEVQFGDSLYVYATAITATEASIDGWRYDRLSIIKRDYAGRITLPDRHTLKLAWFDGNTPPFLTGCSLANYEGQFVR